MGDVIVEVEDPQGRNLAEVVVEDKGNQVYRCTYKPIQAGPHIVKVTFAGEAIPKTPCTVLIGEGMFFKNVYKCRWPLYSLDVITEYAWIVPFIFCTFQHLGPVSVGHLSTLRINQCSLTVIWLSLLVSFLPRLTKVKLPFEFF